MTSDRADTTARVVPPPVVFATALVIGIGVNAAVSCRISAVPLGARLAAAGFLMAGGFALSAWVTWTFRQAGTPISTRRASTHLVRTGPFRWTRNPDYLGQSLLCSGIALAVGTWWPIAVVIAAFVVVHVSVVHREERYLSARFGDAYREYCRDVPRWLGIPR